MIKINSMCNSFNEIFNIYFKEAFQDKPPIILCIGSERATGDALAPLIGTMLRNKYNIKTYVYGTLESSVNAKNIEEVYSFITLKHPAQKILAIDACVGLEQDIGFVKFTNTGLFARSAIKKVNKNYGDYSILGIVDKAYKDPLNVFSTRLSTVFNLGNKIANAIDYAFNMNYKKIAL